METLTALLLTLLILMLLASLAVRQRSVGEILARRSEVVEARRVTRDLVELTVASGGVRAAPGDEMELRFFVGWALPCADGTWRYRGRRAPDPLRDSLWVVSAWGEVTVASLASVGGGECAGTDAGQPALRMEGDPALASPVLVRVFESGRFRLSDALRYGRIGDPAQPLTGAVLDPSVSALRILEGTVSLTARGKGDSATVRRSWRLP
ncbi:MAG TPA: hypothetical protein VLA43_02560 [Longimicrobiales bacterium]|nr:hypothetical protein [Longimicrobiales bacterium]